MFSAVLASIPALCAKPENLRKQLHRLLELFHHSDCRHFPQIRQRAVTILLGELVPLFLHAVRAEHAHIVIVFVMKIGQNQQKITKVCTGLSDSGG